APKPFTKTVCTLENNPLSFLDLGTAQRVFHHVEEYYDHVSGPNGQNIAETNECYKGAGKLPTSQEFFNKAAHPNSCICI
ncbi:hypothetical protein Ocin01_04787, partial [Orchesella cincta]